MNQLMARGLCPSCGQETLETTEMIPERVIHTGLPAQHGILLFECGRCLWQGSTATLNVV